MDLLFPSLWVCNGEFKQFWQEYPTQSEYEHLVMDMSLSAQLSWWGTLFRTLNLSLQKILLKIMNAPQTVCLYSGSLSSGSDVSTQTQLWSVWTHSLFLRARKPVCAISLGAWDLALHLANKRTTSLPEDSEPEYNHSSYIFKKICA